MDNFFHAIIHGNLQVQFKDSFSEFPDRIIDQNTIDKYKGELADDSQTPRFIKLSQRTPGAEKVFSDVGKISIRIDVTPKTNGREFALVRDSGMLIISNQSEIKCRLPHLKGFPAHWSGFTAVIECQSTGKGLLRQAESPGHDCIRVSYIREAELHSYADNIFKEIGLWCREQIKNLAEPKLVGGLVNAGPDIAPFLILEQGDSVSDPEEILEPPRGVKGVKGRGGGGGGGGGRGGGGGGGGGSEPNAVPLNIRFTPGPNPTHSVVVTFDRSDDLPTDIKLSAIGEDGEGYLVGIRQATLEGKPLAVENDLIVLPATDQERQEIEILTREPIQDKSFDLRFVRPRQ